MDTWYPKFVCCKLLGYRCLIMEIVQVLCNGDYTMKRLWCNLMGHIQQGCKDKGYGSRNEVLGLTN